MQEAEPIGDHICKVEAVPNEIQLPENEAQIEEQQQAQQTIAAFKRRRRDARKTVEQGVVQFRSRKERRERKVDLTLCDLCALCGKNQNTKGTKQ